ncbi:phosphate ABC transporter substrate-binding protein PstS [Trebonia kvetii]|uniref:Phosphate-binding protein n=1 Tax=Trebonia kvetii TaxID=2480626 RepID=A0A6P2CBE0_9ACTN|nr:phosphate ABC transporter substrate-binding protein PstS [Trebonia kvetii]TVZ07261.1 phosphate ABC transporter substrate-binding protein PstS [Trebonia kvetii]
MPYLLSRQRPHVSPRRAPAGPAAILLALLLSGAVTACTSTATTANPQPTTADVADLSGAGSTFDAPFFDLAFPAYEQAHLYTGINYSAVGSSAGITRFTAGQVDFGATDVPASTADLAGARGGPALQIPVDLGAVTVAYNVLTLSNAPLRLTGPVLARIFLGQITKWNDPALTALNPGAQLPDAYITVVHRSDGSGTTYIFSNYLSQVSPAWASSVGTGRSLRWPAGTGADGNAGVAADVSRIQYSIGYTERSYTTGTSLGNAAIANRDGRYTMPTTPAIAADAAAKPDISPDDFSIVNEPGPAAYPITGYSWVLIYLRQPSQPVGQALVSLLTWLTHAGQAYAGTLGYVPLPTVVQQLAASTLALVTGPDGTPLAS